MRDDLPLPGRDYAIEGVRLHAVTCGPDDDNAVVLIHGFPTSSYLWRDTIRDLCEARAGEQLAIAPDLVHLGRSERPHRRVGLAEQARLIVALLHELEVGRWTVVGHGLGGAVAVHIAVLEPARTVGLGLIASPVHADVWPVRAVVPLLVPGAGAVAGPGMRLAPRLGRRMLAQSLGAEASGPRIDAYLEPLLGPGGGRGLADFAAAVDLEATQAAWEIVRAAPPPSLIMWGTEDSVHSVSYGRRVADELPDAAWVPVTGAGHLLPEERPERVAEEIAGFVAELASC